eukprot:CAMPEP_0172532980 /NCGR_PEP_ID=MMETSP1067-20121228/5830_1 /TAXON_ID=265564 ORGANISM="Thalassiosira punctigera, Strain Tpunct2005C2" /NCGR_SAMPLE_ID=MMETSP1067 /ASSEMBLY_ACC=CAM_ASM_000444 /LENGTH=371 /DNA_ID=CAMNT_0013317559 /DNA_START=196 /DNA_END=1311 /DNA_ORIENTATION=+
MIHSLSVIVLILLMEPSPILFVASYSASLQNLNYPRSQSNGSHGSVVLRMQFGNGAGGGMNGINYEGGGSMNGQSNSFGSQSSMNGGMGQGNGMMGQGNMNAMGQWGNNNNMQGMQGSRGDSQQSIESRYNQPAGSSVSEADFVKSDGYYDAWRNAPRYRPSGRSATLRDVGANQFPATELGSIASQSAQPRMKEIERYAYSDENMYPSMLSEREMSQQYYRQQQFHGGSSDYSRGFSSDVQSNPHGGYYSSEGLGGSFQSANLSGLSQELRRQELWRGHDGRRDYYDFLGRPAREYWGREYDGDNEDRFYSPQGLGERRRDGFERRYEDDGMYSSGHGDYYYGDETWDMGRSYDGPSEPLSGEFYEDDGY